jgi:signal transduction histidine kinase
MSALVHILMVEDNPADARLTRELLREADGLAIDLVHADSLTRGLECMDGQSFDAVLLDLSLPDTTGIEGVTRVNDKNPVIPIIVLSGQVNEEVAIAALQEGAQDYLIKGQGDGYLIGRTIRYAMERKRIECQLIEAKKAAEAADRAKTDFLANMSHELRTPLNAIIGFSSMMSMEVRGPLGDTAYKEYANDIHQSGCHLLDVINDILDLSKISVGKYDIDAETLCLPEVIDDCVHMVRLKAEAARLELIIDVPSDLPPLCADERIIKRILLNLLSNAIKFTEKGFVRIAAWSAPDGGMSLAVEDTGIGISRAALPRLMRPFVQADGSLARKYEGTGLGLSLVKSMIELHAGTIELSSELGVGTKVALHFPPERTGACPIEGEPKPIARLSQGDSGGSPLSTGDNLALPRTEHEAKRQAPLHHPISADPTRATAE